MVHRPIGDEAEAAGTAAEALGDLAVGEGVSKVRGSLHWAVKPSFVRYVRTVAAGRCEAVDGATESAAGVFEFPLVEFSEQAEGRVLSFGGGVRFSAHHGFLDVDLRELELTLTPQCADLRIAAAEGSVIIATMDAVVPVNDAGLLRWTGLVPRLTEVGVEVFGDVYQVGSEMDPLDAAVILA
jgi:hypothetical protein